MMTKALAHLQKTYLQIIREHLLPWVQMSQSRRILLAEPPFKAPEGVKVKACQIAPLMETGRGISGSANKWWPQHRLMSTPSPSLAFIYEGEADFWFGVTRRIAKELGQKNVRGRYVVSLPTHSLCVVPPRVPHNSGEAHWERPLIENAFSRLFNIHIAPTSVLLHTCTTKGQSHTSDPVLCLRDPHIPILNDLLIGELRKREAHCETVAGAYLLAIVFRIERQLSTEQAVMLTGETVEREPISATPEAANTTTLQRACHYVETHLDEQLTPADIARHAYVSPSHLNRLFRSEFNMSIMDYVGQCRAESAKTLLLTTELMIADVGSWVGMNTPSHFTRCFRRWTNMSPAEFRSRHRKTEPA